MCVCVYGVCDVYVVCVLCVSVCVWRVVCVCVCVYVCVCCVVLRVLIDLWRSWFQLRVSCREADERCKDLPGK